MKGKLILLDEAPARWRLKRWKRAGDALWVALSPTAERCLERLDLPYRAPRADSVRAGAVAVRRLAYRWQQRFWAHHQGDDAWRRRVFTYRGLDIGNIVRDGLFRGFFNDRARAVLELKAIVAEVPATEVLYVPADPGGRAVLRTVGQDLGLRVQEVITWRSRLRGFLRRWRRVVPLLRSGLAFARIPRRGVAIADAASGPLASRPLVIFLARSPVHLIVAQDVLRLLEQEYDVHLITNSAFALPDGLSRCTRTNWRAYMALAGIVRALRHCLSTSLFVLTHSRLSAGSDGIAGQFNRAAEWVAGLELSLIAGMLVERVMTATTRHRPGLVMLMDETGPFGKAWATVCEAKGIPTLDIQHGQIGYFPWRTSNDIPYTRFAAFGESSKELLVERGVDPSRVVITGPARYDRLCRPGELKTREQVSADLGLDAHRRLVVFASQPVTPEIPFAAKQRAIGAVSRAAERIQGCQLVIKLHPGERDDPASFAQRVSGGTPLVLADQDYDLYDLLAACDVMATIYSTTIWEAIALGKPVLCVDVLGEPDLLAAAAEGAALAVQSVEEVEPALRSLLFDEAVREELQRQRERFIERHLYRCDGRAAERVAGLARSLVLDAQTVGGAGANDE